MLASNFVYICGLIGYMFQATVDSASCLRFLGPIDIRSEHGVWIERLPGSRVVYDPFPNNFYVTIGDNITIDFITKEPSGLIFLLGDFKTGDLVAANLSHGYLTFIRRCGRGRAIETYTKRLDDGAWHSLRFTHNIRGGKLDVDNWNPYRRYHLGPCSNFSSLMFGGLTLSFDIQTSLAFSMHHRFQGCLSNMRINGLIPAIHPEYVAVSACQNLK